MIVLQYLAVICLAVQLFGEHGAARPQRRAGPVNSDNNMAAQHQLLPKTDRVKARNPGAGMTDRTRNISPGKIQLRADFGIDHDLYLACKEDVGKFCGEMFAEEGQVYRCLFQNKFNHEMSQQCREAMIVRNRLITQDYKASDGIQQYCRKDIRKLHCKEITEENHEGKGKDEADVMRCLIENRDELTKQCEAGINHVQLSKLQDVKFSYAFVKACKGDIKAFCRHDNSKQQMSRLKITECLSGMHLDSIMRMGHSALTDACTQQLKFENFQRHEGLECLSENHDRISQKCWKELFTIDEKEATDQHVNVMRGCETEIIKLCDNSADPESIEECLIYHEKEITQRCLDKVREQERKKFFDINMDPDLVRECHGDLKIHCNDIVQEAIKEDNAGEDIHSEAVNCLQEIELDQNPEKQQLSKKCSRHIRFIMEEDPGDYKQSKPTSDNAQHQGHPDSHTFCPKSSHACVIAVALLLGLLLLIIFLVILYGERRCRRMKENLIPAANSLSSLESNSSLMHAEDDNSNHGAGKDVAKGCKLPEVQHQDKSIN